MRYIYLNHYNKYLYVGSHVWNGEGIDPTYEGSSKVANLYNWLPDEIEILEVLSEDDYKIQLERERYWILLYCNKYGIADCAARLNHNQKWINQFPKHGLMLNLHANGCEQAVEAAHTPEVIAKLSKTREELGIWKKFSQAGCKVASSKESREKAAKTLEENPDQKLKMTSGLRSKEVAKRAAQKRSEQRRNNPNYARPRIIELYKDGILIAVGPVKTCIKQANEPNVDWVCSSICRKLQNGEVEFDCRGYHIKFTGEYKEWSKVSSFNKAHTKEAREKSVANHDYQQVTFKMSETKKSKGIKPEFKEFEVYKDAEFVCKGSGLHCATTLGNPNYATSICRKGKCSDVFYFHGYQFKVIYNE